MIKNIVYLILMCVCLLTSSQKPGKEDKMDYITSSLISPVLYRPVDVFPIKMCEYKNEGIKILIKEFV